MQVDGGPRAERCRSRRILRVAGGGQPAAPAFAEALAATVHRACQRWRRTLKPSDADRAAAWLDRLAQEAEVEGGPAPSRSERV
ncbi:MAG: hypothetical protein ACI9K2_007453, partial [Myxococcota bacterium]